MNDGTRRIAESTPDRAELGLPEAGFVFCCFNNNHKITPSVFDIWMRLLRAVPGSVLWMLADNTAAVANLRRAAIARGVEASRLVFAERIELAEHLARQRRQIIAWTRYLTMPTPPRAMRYGQVCPC